jgi:hypothetical protein
VLQTVRCVDSLLIVYAKYSIQHPAQGSIQDLLYDIVTHLSNSHQQFWNRFKHRSLAAIEINREFYLDHSYKALNIGLVTFVKKQEKREIKVSRRFLQLCMLVGFVQYCHICQMAILNSTQDLNVRM